MTINEHFNIVFDRLLPLKSWTEKEKSSLLDTMVNWRSQLEDSRPERLEMNMLCLRELFSDDIIMHAMLPVKTILQVIQSNDIPAEIWLDCLRNALQSNMGNDAYHQNTISFDFTPVVIPAINFDRQLSNTNKSTNRNKDEIDRPCREDVKLTHELLSCATSSITTQTSVNPSPKEEPLDIYRSILIENLIELNELKWPKSDICSLRNRFTSPVISNNISSLKTALLIIETIVTNEISSQAHIDRIVRTINESSADQWMNELNKIVDERGKAKSVDILLEELASENSSLNIKRLRKQYERVMDYYKYEISSWTTTDLEQNHQCNDEDKKVAIIVQAAHLYKQYRPRDIQILSLLLLIDKPENGRLAQIRTGEGKSLIVSMLAVYLSLPPLNKHVDIITTSEILAQRDADEFAPFYRMFGLSVGHNCHEPSVTPNYNVNIVYGTVVQFAGDLLRTDFYLQTEIRGNRPYDAAIVDEVDSMFIDQRQHYTQLASLTPGYKSLNIILRFIYSYFQKYNITENNEFVIRQANGFSKVDAVKFIRTKMAEKELIHYPNYRRDYINAKLPKWIRGARRAFYELTLNVDYVISKDGRIVVVDYANTGVSHMNMHWSDGVHQFLELKHNLRMTPERMCDSFFSNVTLFKRYQPHLYGVTGTLGGMDARKFIQSVYKIDTVNVPKYTNSDFDIYQSRFSSNRPKWLENIRNECHEIAIVKRRAVLIICETILDAEDVQSALFSQHHGRLKLYLRSDLSEYVKPEEVHSGDVIVATNLAGRGTDLKTMTVVNEKGGLHVIVTFMPRNSRVEQQAFGRAGRQGQPGSARLIVYNENIALQFNENIDETMLIDAWKDVRNQQEKSVMNEAITDVQRVEAKDRLLVRFLDLVHSKKHKLPFANDMYKPGFSSLRESWASFCDGNETEAEQSFSRFEKQIEKQMKESIAILDRDSFENDNDLIKSSFQAVSHLIAHPKYFIYAGFHALCTDGMDDNRQEALNLYKRALEIDSEDFVAHYNTVPCYIKNNQTSITGAIEAFDQAIKLLNVEIETRKLLEIFHDPPTSDENEAKKNEPVDQTSLAELIYLQIVNSTFEQSREQLKQFDEEKHEIICEFKHWPETLECLKGTKLEPLTNDINAEREEWLGEGLMWRYVFIIRAKRCWWKTVFVFVMGVAQIVGGAYLCFQGQFRLGTSLILDGALDVYKSVATNITADFDLANYFEGKVVKYGKLLFTAGGPLEAVASLEKIQMVGVAIDAVRQIDKNGFTMENLTQLAEAGMSLAGVDQKTVDFVKKLPERIKDAEALLSGDINKILERGQLAGLPVQTIRNIAKNGLTCETASQIVIDGMTMAGVDQKAIDVVKQLPERIKDAEALLSGDVNRILERGVLAGLPLHAVQKIVQNGFSAENITQLIADGMTFQGVDQTTIDLVKQLPERFKDAEALLSGDIDKILERGKLAGLPLNAIQQIATNGFSAETAAQLAVDGMTMAGVDQRTIDIVKQLPARIEDAQALLSGDVNRIMQRGMLAGLPVQAIQQIVRNGFSADNITQLIADGMTFQGVDRNTIDLVKQLPERFKDAEALLSGDVNKILERGKLAGLPLNAIQQIAINGFSAETAGQLATDGMALAGVDQKAIDVVKQLPARIEDAQALLSGDINRIMERGILAGLPLAAVQKITRNGFSAENITQLIADGITFQGVDQNTIDLVKQLPERFKDAEALLSGDVNKILERGKLAGLPLNAIQQIATNGFSAETATQLAIDGMALAGVDQNAINSVKTLCEQVYNIQALANGNIGQLLEYAESAGLPVNIVRQIATNGLTSESATQLVLEGMNLAGVDAKKMDFVKKLPEQIKDAQALLSGDIDEICRRGILGGIPVNTVRDIFRTGLSLEAATQLAIDGMNTANVDPKQLELLRQLPERMKDAKALLSGDINEMLGRGMSAGLPLNAIQRIVTNGFSAETATQLAMDGMNLAGVDSKKIDFIKKLPEKIQDAQALLSGDIDEICRRGILDGIPVSTVREIFRNGLSLEAATQFALDRMNTADVDPKALDLLRQLPERMKDAKALFSGDIHEMLGRGMSAGLPLNAIQQIATNGFSSEIATQLALDGMNLAGVDAKKIDFVKKLPEQIKDAQALLSGDIDEICRRGILSGIPVNTVRDIFRSGLSLEAATQLAIDGMNTANVDPKQLDLLRQLPERMKDAQALLSGNVNEMLERGMSAGLPVNAIQRIVTNGFSAETATQLALDGMSLAGVDSKKVDLVKKLPEKIQDAQAVLSGDINEICKRSTFADVSINAIREIATQKNSVEAIKEIALNGMAVAGVDKSTLEFVNKLPEGIDDMKSLLINTLENLFDRNMPTSVDRLFRMCSEQSLFKDKEKEIFEMICQGMSRTQNVIYEDERTVLLQAFETWNKKVSSLPLNDLLAIALPNALRRVIERENESIQEFFNSTIDQLQSMNSTLDNQTREVINQILQSDNKWAIFERTKYQLNDHTRGLLSPVIEREKQFQNGINYLKNHSDAIESCCQHFRMKFDDSRNQASRLRNAIDQYIESSNIILKQAMIEIIDEITTQTKQIRNPKLITLLKGYFNENIISPFVEMACEYQMDQCDTDLVNHFTAGITYVRNHQNRR